MEKLPDVFRQYFLKEGVVHATEQLAALPLPASAEAAAGGAAAAGMDGEEVSAPPRGRRLSSGRPASHAGDKDGGERGGPAAVGTRTPGGDTLRSAVGTRARRFNARYFTDAQGHTVGKQGRWGSWEVSAKTCSGLLCRPAVRYSRCC